MKSSTDKFWNQQPIQESDPAKVNIADTVQRDFELEFVFPQLTKSMKMLEVGCGNGYVSQQLREKVKFLDSFDYAENMIEQAKNLHGEKNNRFFVDNILDPKHVDNDYDMCMCVRVLINLRDFEEQKLAVANLAKLIKQGGTLILIEGFRDGFDKLSESRVSVGLPKLEPASINFYSYLKDFVPYLEKDFIIKSRWNSSLFDFLTRLIYPLLVGPENSAGPGEFHEKITNVIRTHSFEGMSPFARLHGFALTRR